MVIYDFRCVEGHTFEGWFASRDACRRQEEARMVRCPVCDTDAVSRELSAPAVQRQRLGAPRRAEPGDDAAVASAAAPTSPRESGLRALSEAVRELIERHCEDVGPGFAREATAMFLGDKEPRNIVGTTTDEEARDLGELGVPFARVQLPRFDD